MSLLWKIGWFFPVVGLGATPAAPGPLKETVLPFVEKHCSDCHWTEVHKKDLNLAPFRDERSILRGRETWEKVLDKVESGEMPPPKKSSVNPHDREAFLATVRSLFETADRNLPPDPGHVVVRRLNRTEYNNTIRDLLGVDFQPAEDFPSDEIGYGFDNIGDVLSLSPVLMERYLAAAEQIAQRAVVVGDLPKPPTQRTESKFLEPKLPNELKKDYRPLETGALFTPVKVDPREEYTLRTKIYTNAKSPPRVVLLACGKKIAGAATDAQVSQVSGDVSALRPFVILKTVDVAAHSDDDKQYIEVKIPPNTERVAIAILKPAVSAPGATNPPASPVSAPTVFVKYLSVVGPMDTRPLFQRKFMVVTPGKTQREQTRDILSNFVSHAYRRPLAREEIERVSKLVDDTVAAGEKWELGIQRAIQAVLVSPKFLFRLETDADPQTRGAHPLDEFALASRLSYFLWSSMPDDELFGLATQKKLSANLDAQVRRMLADPKGQALVDNFALQWLQLRRLEVFRPDPTLFPSYTKALQTAMTQETRLFFGEIMRQDRSVLELIDADFTYLNESLAALYGIADTRGNRFGDNNIPAEQRGQPIQGQDFVRVSLRDRSRGGLLTQASVLTVTSNPTRTSPVKRGRFVLEQILGLPQPPAAPNVPQLPEDQKAISSGSLRERMERHRADPSCASCHARMDPLGFALENFNAIGAYRREDSGFPINSSGTMPDGTSFNGAIELKAAVKAKKDLFARCLTEKMLTYALGRGLESYDRRTVGRITAALAKDNYRFSTLVIEITKSDPFRLQKGKE